MGFYIASAVLIEELEDNEHNIIHALGSMDAESEEMAERLFREDAERRMPKAVMHDLIVRDITHMSRKYYTGFSLS